MQSMPNLQPSLPVISRVIKTVLIDLSGTLHIEDLAIPGAVEALNRLRRTDVTVKFVTNTTKDSSRILYERLTKLGFNLKLDEIHSSLGAAKALIHQRKLKPLLFLSKDALEDFEGLNYEPHDKPNAVVIGLAPEEFYYDRLNQAFRCLLDGAELIAIHVGKYYKSSNGMNLGPGAFIRGLEYSAQCKATVIGKPTKLFFDTVLDGAKPGESVMIGDDVTDDIGGAQDAGLRGFLVKTGKYREKDETKINPQPTAIFDSFVEAVKEIERINKIIKTA